MALKDLFPSLKINAQGDLEGLDKLPDPTDLVKDLERLMPLESYPLPRAPLPAVPPLAMDPLGFSAGILGACNCRACRKFDLPAPSMAGFGLKDIELKWIPTFMGTSLQISAVPAKNAADGKDNNNGERDPLYLISSAPLPVSCDTPAKVLEWVRTQVISSISHEVDEWLRVDGHPVRDPHPENARYSPPPQLAADYLERRKREIAAEVRAAQPLKAEIAALSDSDPLPGVLAEIKDKP